jgi:hypothetical protein
VGEVEERLARLTGLTCWGSHYDPDTEFRLNFGDPHLDVAGPVRHPGEPRTPLDIYRDAVIRGELVMGIDPLARWRITFPDIEPVTGSSSFRRIGMAESRLDGQRFVSAVVNPATGTTRITLDTSTVLEIRRPSRGYDEGLWELRESSAGHYLTVYATGEYRSWSTGDPWPSPMHRIGD